jgi:serine/threonine-protein kinase RsbW
MVSPAGQPWLLLDSTLAGVDEGESLVKAVLSQSQLPEDDQYWVLLAVREVLVNAAFHGNCYDASKKVSLRISHSSSAIAIDIGDEGDGFDPDAVPDPKVDQNLEKQSGRGLFIARSFLDEITIERRVPKGTLVHLTKKLKTQS